MIDVLMGPLFGIPTIRIERIGDFLKRLWQDAILYEATQSGISAESIRVPLESFTDSIGALNGNYNFTFNEFLTPFDTNRGHGGEFININ